MNLSQAWRRSVGYVTVSAAAVVGFLAIFRPWGYRIRVPFSYGKDNFFYAMLVKNMILYGGYGYSPSLGAPYGQELYDFPQGGDRLNILILKFLTYFSKDPFLVLNLFYALTFVLIALSAYLVLRHLKVGALVAGCASLLYAFLPYHHQQELQHPFLSSYYAVPLTVLVALWAAEGGLPLTRTLWREWDPRDRRRRMLSLAAIAIVVGSASVYYALFGVLLIAGSGLLRAVRSRSFAPGLATAAACGLIVFVVAANLAPELKFRLDHGANPEVANRPAAESEEFGLHLSQMLVPNPDHQLSVLDSLGKTVRDVKVPGEKGAYLGAIGVFGVLLAVGALLLGKDTKLLPARTRWLGGLILYATAIGTVGGLGFLVAVLGFTQIRGWGRIVVVIGFMALLVMAFFADTLLRRASGRGARLLALGIVLVTIGGLIDQTPPGAHPDYYSGLGQYNSDKTFFRGLESALPDGGMVFQLPVVPFPESAPVINLDSYEHLRGYIIGTGKLRWSAGGMRGRVSDWQTSWQSQPVPRMIDGLAAAGFDALYIDRLGYQDNGAAIERAVESVLGAPASVSPNQRMRWYDLRPERQRLLARVGNDRLDRAGAAVVTTPQLTFGDGISFDEAGADGTFQWMSTTGTVTIVNRGDDNREMTLHTRAVGPSGSHLTVQAAGVEQQFVVSTAGTEVNVPFVLPAGTTTVQLSTDAPQQIAVGDLRDLRVQLFSLTIADTAIVDVLGL